MLIDGICCNIPLHQNLMRDAEFQKGCVNIHYLEKKLES
jgi:acetyl-CoA carboxylase biotin carboxylase subunit